MAKDSAARIELESHRAVQCGPGICVNIYKKTNCRKCTYIHPSAQRNGLRGPLESNILNNLGYASLYLSVHMYASILLTTQQIRSDWISSQIVPP